MKNKDELIESSELTEKNLRINWLANQLMIAIDLLDTALKGKRSDVLDKFIKDTRLRVKRIYANEAKF